VGLPLRSRTLRKRCSSLLTGPGCNLYCILRPEASALPGCSTPELVAPRDYGRSAPLFEHELDESGGLIYPLRGTRSCGIGYLCSIRASL
jgi:hypothetical protein